MKGKFIAGTFDKVYIATPRTASKDGRTWENYTLHCVNGFYEQPTMDGTSSADGMYFNSSYKVPVFDTESDTPIDPKIIDGKKFDGRILVSEDGKYLQAICVVGNIVDDSSRMVGNPFLSNPIA